MNAPPKSSWLLTVDEYLAFEEQSEIRHEYVGGEIHAMAGASESHQIIVFNVASALREAARLSFDEVYEGVELDTPA